MHKPCLWCLALLSSLLLLSDCLKSHADDWPQWRGPRRDGISTETGLLPQWPEDGPKLLWDSKKVNGGLGVGRGYSSVAVAKGRIFTLGDRKKDGFVFALDEVTGKQLWATRIAPGQGDGPRCTPTVDGDRVYALSRQGELVCLGVERGEVRWRKNFKDDFGGRMMSDWDYSESPLIDGDRLICTPGGDEATLVALDKYTGETVWQAAVPKGGGAGYASIVVAEVGGIRQYMTLLGSGLVSVGAKDGKLLWRYAKVANGTANIPTALVRGDLVFCSTGYNRGAALLRLVPVNGGVEAKEIYFLKGNVLQNHHGGMVLLGEHVYGGHGHNAGAPFCLGLKTGSFACGPEEQPGDGSAAVVYADGHLYLRYQDGVMALVEATPQAYRLKSQFNLPAHLGTPGWAHPVVANGRLYIRGNDVLLCYDLRASGKDTKEKPQE
jgi:outer membrane protein assembly factor BamB